MKSTVKLNETTSITHFLRFLELVDYFYMLRCTQPFECTVHIPVTTIYTIHTHTSIGIENMRRQLEPTSTLLCDFKRVRRSSLYGFPIITNEIPNTTVAMSFICGQELETVCLVPSDESMEPSEEMIEKELTFSALPTDVIQYIFAFQDFVNLSEILFGSVKDTFGRFQDGQILSLYCNIMLDDSTTKGNLFNPDVPWKTFCNLNIGKYFIITYLTDLLDTVVSKCPNLRLYLECEIVMKQKNRYIFDKLLKYADQVKNISLFECPKSIIIDDVLKKLNYLDSIMLGRTEIDDIYAFVSALNCKHLSLAWIGISKNQFPYFLRNVRCKSLSLYVIDMIDSCDTCFMNGIEENMHIRSLRLVQKQACLYPLHVKQINENKNIRSLSLDLENEVKIEDILEEVGNNMQLESVELTNYLNDINNQINLKPFTRMKNLRNIFLFKTFMEQMNPNTIKAPPFPHPVDILPSQKYLELE